MPIIILLTVEVLLNLTIPRQEEAPPPPPRHHCWITPTLSRPYGQNHSSGHRHPEL